MEQKAAQELLGPHLYDLRGRPGRVVFGTKADHAVPNEDESRVSDGHAMGIATEVLQHLPRAADWRFGVDNPAGAEPLAEEWRPGLVLGHCGTGAGQAELVLGPQPGQAGEILAPEDFTEGLDGKQEAAATLAPLRAIGGQAPSGHHTVDVDMLGQRLAPSMKHGGDAKFSPQVVGITSELLQGLSGSLEQQVVERPLVDPKERIEGMGQSEDEVEVGHWQQQSLLGRQPLGPSTPLALRTVAIAAGVIADPLAPTGVTGLEVPAEGCRPTLRDSAQDLGLLVRDVRGSAERFPVLPHDIRHLKAGALRVGICACRCR
jgi:hypothetical protein